MTVKFHGSSDDSRTLEGYASTYGNEDRDGDIIRAGAFASAVDKIKNEGLPFLADHSPSLGNVLGTIVDAVEDDKGLYIKVKFADTPDVEPIYQKAKQGHLNRMSVGFMVLDAEPMAKGLLIKQADLLEVSLVAIPANPKATVLSVKNLEENKELEKQVELAAEDKRAEQLETAKRLTREIINYYLENNNNE